MAAESGNYIDDLIPTAPAGSESRSFGDDHIRLIKKVLVNTFAGFPGAVIVTGTESSGASANDFVVFIDPQPTTYTNRMLVSFLATHNNSGAASIRINSLSPVSFVANDGTALTADTIKNGSEVLAVFDGTQFRLIAANNVQPLPPDELPNQAGHEGQFLTTNGAAVAWQPLTILRSPQAGGYTILQSDLSKLIYWTGSSISFIGIVAASALGAGWYCYIYNAGTAAITIDPTGAETINGQANITLQPSQGAIIQCNGANFVTLDFNRLPSPTGQNGKWLTTDGNAAQWADLPSSSLPPMAGNDGLFLSTDGIQGVWVSIPFPPNELPSQTGQGGQFLQTNGTTVSWEDIPKELPPQTGNEGRILSTDGTDPLWIDAPTGGGGGGVEELPPQAGQAGKFLQTNGTDPAWANVPAELPSQTGQGGTFLSTDGANPLWAIVPPTPSELPPQTGHATQFLTTDGTNPSWAAVPPTPPELPSQTGNNGRILSTDGINPTWINTPTELPSQTGQAGKVLTTDGSIPSWSEPVSNIRVLPIFDASVISYTPYFGGNTITNGTISRPITTGSLVGVDYNSTSGLFVLTGTVAANGNFFTSPNGVDWTARAITSAGSLFWRACHVGLNHVAVHNDATSTASLRSTDGGITWIAGGTLSAAPSSSSTQIVGIGTTFLVGRGSSAYLLTTNSGVSWTTVSPPATFSNDIFAINGLFWAWISGTTAYTSPTGASVSWTIRTLPVAPASGSIVQSPDKQWITFVSSVGSFIYESSDGLNWTNTNIVYTGTSAVVYKISNGIYYSPTYSTGVHDSYVWINGKLVIVKNTINATSGDKYSATNGSGLYLFNSGTSIYNIDSTVTGLFA